MLENRGKTRQNKSGPGSVGSAHPTLDISTYSGGERMPFVGDYPDSAGKSKPEESDNWKSLGDLARKLAEKAGGAS